MDAKKLTKVSKEIEDTAILIDYLLSEGIPLSMLCACLDMDCQECIYYDQNYFSDRKVREAKEWNIGNNG